MLIAGLGLRAHVLSEYTINTDKGFDLFLNDFLLLGSDSLHEVGTMFLRHQLLETLAANRSAAEVVKGSASTDT